MTNVKDFFDKFPTDDACLDHLMETRYGKEFECPNCKRNAKFYRLKKQPVYLCQWCGWHIHPMAGTIFQDSHTPLQKWFYAIYLFTTTRHGVAAKEVQRQISVTYKTAWRMCHQIRQYMAEVDGDDALGGTVEVDETYVGGIKKGFGRGKGVYMTNKTVVFGMVERNGDVMTRVVPNAQKKTLYPIIKENVKQFSKIMSDDSRSYDNISKGPKGYIHQSVDHTHKEYVRGNAHINSIEGFWSQLKRSIKGTHIHVSKRHMPKYLGEFEFRYNMRSTPYLMFDRLLKAF